MGKSYKPLKFFLDTITIVAHSATAEEHLSVPVTVRDFAGGEPVRLSECQETGDFLLETVWRPVRFIEGPSA